MLLVRETIFEQLTLRLKQLLNTAEYPVGAQFPTERDVSTRFRVSRPTANKALAALVGEGLLEFRKGVGTFVARKGLDYDLRHLVSFTDRALAAGKQPTTRLIQFDRAAGASVPRFVRSALKAADEDALIYIERVRLADDLPLIFEKRWVNADLCPRLRPSDARGSLYGAWSGRHGLEIAGADQSIRAACATKSEAAMLELRRGAPVLVVTATGYLVDGRALWTERTLYRADCYEFTTRLGALRSPRPAIGRFTTDNDEAEMRA
jgi:GntR family transcriptional regulator